MCFAPQRRALFRNLNFQKCSEAGVLCAFWLGNVLRATTACAFSTSQLSKVVRHWRLLYILTWKRASRHNGVHFFDISTSKSGPSMVCFVHFDFEMCFAPQRRALFQHPNFERCPEPGVFCVWLRYVLRAATACNFSSLICQMALHPPLWRAYLSNLWSHKSLEKQWIATFLPFRAPASSFLWLFLFPDLLSSFFFLLPSSLLFSSSFFSSLLFFLLLFSSLLPSSLLFSSLAFSGSSHLCFSICPYCRKFDV